MILTKGVTRVRVIRATASLEATEGTVIAFAPGTHPKHPILVVVELGSKPYVYSPEELEVVS